MAEANEEMSDEDEGVNKIQSYLTLILDSPPSCLEFVPLNKSDDHYFVVGTYSLDAGRPPESADDGQRQTRTGSLQLFTLNDIDL